MSGFRHEALLYRGAAGFVQAVTPIVRDALDRGESVLVAVPEPKARALRPTLPVDSVDSGQVTLVDMAAAGRNPARSVSIWHQFARQARPPEQRLGIAELVWAERTADEIIECQHAEAVLNLVLAGSSLSLTCAYDTAELAATDIKDAAHHHLGIASMIGEVRFPEPALPEPPTQLSVDYQFGGGDLQQIREYVGIQATAFLVERLQVHDLVLAVNELATNSIRHGGGRGRLRIWLMPDSLLCEVSDAGLLDQPLAGMCPPSSTGDGGAGMWLVHQICDLVQVRSSEQDGTVVRLTMHRNHRPAGGDLSDLHLGVPSIQEKQHD
ncbi:MAG TPA: anti-sigma factor RsbA family regulatory protein [Actinomycetes bacterium]|nr:anti-sigma factor RsbA family regulatory protein [Actinomycetes bacterium]